MPEGSHGTFLQVALDPAQPVVFTTIGSVQDVPQPELSRAQTMSTGQESLVSTFVSSKLLVVGSVDFTIWYDSTDGTHNAAIGATAGGLYFLLMGNTTRPFRFKGPQEALDIIDVVAHVSAVSKSSPVNEGIYEATITLQPTGEITVEGETITNP